MTDKASTSITVDWQLPDSPSRIFLFDGGNNGFKLGSNQKVMHLTYIFTYIYPPYYGDFAIYEDIWLRGRLLLLRGGDVDQNELRGGRRPGLHHALLLLAGVGESNCMHFL